MAVVGSGHPAEGEGEGEEHGQHRQENRGHHASAAEHQPDQGFDPPPGHLVTSQNTNADTTTSAAYCEAMTAAAGTRRDPMRTSMACGVRTPTRTSSTGDSPWVVALNVVALLFLALHVVTWFNLTPQAMDVRMGSRRVPAAAVIASQYAALVVVSAFVFWLVTR